MSLRIKVAAGVLGVVLCLALILPKGIRDTCSGSHSGDQPSQNKHPTDVLNTLLRLNKEARACEQPDELAKPQFDQEPQVWQTVGERPVKVFSAFYEGRPEADGLAIRVVGAGLQTAYNSIGDLYCTLWYDDIEEGVATGFAIYDNIYPSTMHPDMWVSHFIICPLPLGHNELPYAVSITDQACAPPTNYLMVLNRTPVKKKDTHALCLSPVYGNYNDWKMLINVFEIHKLLGVSAVAVYNMSVSESTDKLLHSYLADPGWDLNVIKWPLLPGRISYFVQRGALNDCLYRMGHYHKYVTMSDLDEVVVPRKVETWPSLLRLIDRRTRGVFMFQHAAFWRNTTLAEPYLVTQQSLWRTHKVEPPGKIRCKSMYKAERAIKVHIHFHYELTPGSEEYMVDPEEGMLHHYREKPMESFLKHPEKYHFVEDLYMTRFKDRLLAAFMERQALIDKNSTEHR